MSEDKFNHEVWLVKVENDVFNEIETYKEMFRRHTTASKRCIELIEKLKTKLKE